MSKTQKLPPRRISFTLTEWSAMRGQSRVSTWRQIRRGELRSVKTPGGRVSIPASEIKRLGLGFED
jgi:predicted site-specific integrase-resolvase